jgi:hypothetical protein
MVVTGAFATHTTRLWDYYICPRSWDVQDLGYIAVNYRSQLQYIGGIVQGPLPWRYRAADAALELPAGVDAEIRNDLNQFRSLLRGEEHWLFILQPLYRAGVGAPRMYGGHGPFTQGHRYFGTLDQMLYAQRTGTEPDDFIGGSTVTDFEG